jgi:hypothetical protein
MLEQGQVVADDFLPKFAAEIRKTFSDGVPAASITARAEMNRFNNAILEIERTIAAYGFLDGVTQGWQTTSERPLSNSPSLQSGQVISNGIFGSLIQTGNEISRFW